ncbi:unnamed protein product, partial [Durusdinium trenchii]
MDELEDLLSDLQKHAKPLVRSLFSGLQEGAYPMVGSRTAVAGGVISYGDDWVDLMAMWFVPGSGFVPPKNDMPTRVRIHDILHRNLHLCPGAQIVCIGDKELGSHEHELFLHDAKICFRPDFDPALPWDCLHNFCGGFSGWSQALRWLDHSREICLGQEIFVDWDPQIMKIWSIKHGLPHRLLPLPSREAWCPAKLVGLCGCVSDPSIIEVCRSQVNLLTTISPPCQSWSKGGRGQGLNDTNGQAFLDALVQAFSLQVIAIVAECADDTAVHPHFRYENREVKTNEIIRSRAPSSADILPTLCAAYTRQHQLAEHHLKQKGPQDLVTQFHARNEDIRVSNQTTIEHIARQECTFRLAIGNANIGDIEIRSVPSTKVIDDFPKDASPLELQIATKHFEDYVCSALFWAVQQVVETLQDDIQPKPCAASVVILPEQLAITTRMSEASGMQFLQRISTLPVFSNRNKRLCQVPGEPDSFLLISAVRDCEEPVNVEVIVRSDQGWTSGACVPPASSSIQFRGAAQDRHEVAKINGAPTSDLQRALKYGDILDIC